MTSIPIVEFLVGPPAAGKSTYAEDRIKQGFRRVSLDAIRYMLGGYENFTPERERLVGQIHTDAIITAVRAGESVVVDNTHLNNTHAKKLAVELWERGLPVHYQTTRFLDCDLDTLLKRNTDRRERGEHSVPDDVVRRMFGQSQSPKARWTVADLALPVIDPVWPIKGLPDAIIVDIDGTLANATTRGPYDFDRCGEDELHGHVSHLAALLADCGATVVLCSGRDEGRRDITVDWLNRHGVIYDHLFMRKAGDQRRDSIVKLELFNDNIRDRWNVLWAADDRQRVLRVWRQLGIKTLDVGPGVEF